MEENERGGLHTGGSSVAVLRRRCWWLWSHTVGPTQWRPNNRDFASRNDFVTTEGGPILLFMLSEKEEGETKKK